MLLHRNNKRTKATTGTRARPRPRPRPRQEQEQEPKPKEIIIAFSELRERGGRCREKKKVGEKETRRARTESKVKV
jgi:hypothetical protein